MDSTAAIEIIPGPSVVKSVPNLEIDEDSTKIQASEVSNAATLNNSERSGKKKVKKPTKEGKLSQKRKTLSDEHPLKRKKTIPISQKVMESIKALKRRNGASEKAILEYMEGQYKVYAKLVKRHVSKYLLSAVEKGIVEQLGGAGNDGRFKMKKVEKITKVEQKLKGNQKSAKAEKVANAGQKSNIQKKIESEKITKFEQKPNQKKAKGEKVAKVKKKLKITQR